MSRRAYDVTHSECMDACVFAGFIGAVAGGLVASFIVAGLMLLGGGA